MYKEYNCPPKIYKAILGNKCICFAGIAIEEFFRSNHKESWTYNTVFRFL